MLYPAELTGPSVAVSGTRRPRAQALAEARPPAAAGDRRPPPRQASRRAMEARPGAKAPPGGIRLDRRRLPQSSVHRRRVRRRRLHRRGQGRAELARGLRRRGSAVAGSAADLRPDRRGPWEPGGARPPGGWSYGPRGGGRGDIRTRPASSSATPEPLTLQGGGRRGGGQNDGEMSGHGFVSLRAKKQPPNHLAHEPALNRLAFACGVRIHYSGPGRAVFARLEVSLRTGADRHRARRRGGHPLAARRRGAQAARRRLRQADPMLIAPDHLLHRGRRHRPDERSRGAGPGGRAGADLFRGCFDPGAGRRPGGRSDLSGRGPASTSIRAPSIPARRPTMSAKARQMGGGHRLICCA